MNTKIKLLIFLLLFTLDIFSQHVEDYWTSQNSNHTEAFYDISFFDENNGCAVSRLGKIVITDDGGENWTPVQLDTDRPFLTVKYVTKERIIIAGTLINSIFISNDGGENWIEQETVLTDGESINEIFFLDSLNGWMLAQDKILNTIDGGENWSIIQTNSFPPPISAAYFFTSVHFMNKNSGWLVDQEGRVLYTLNGGENWELFDTFNSSYFNKVYFKDDLNGWILGHRSFQTSDGGETWNEINDPLFSAILEDISFSSNQVGWIVGWYGKLLKTTDAGQSWVEVEGYPTSIIAIHFSNSSKGWFTGHSGHIWTYDSSLSIDEKTNEIIKVYPNPTNKFLKLDLPISVLGKKLEVYNLSGQVLQTYYINEKHTSLDVSNLTDGLYIINIDNVKAKFIKN